MKRFFIFAAAAVLGICTANAQENKEIEDLKARIAKLEKNEHKQDKILKALPQFSGYLQMGFEATKNSNTFYLKRLRLSGSGDISKTVDYKFQIEFANTTRIIDAFFRYKPFKELSFQFGEFKLPFSMESTENVPTKMEFVDYPLPVRKLLNYGDICGISASGRDIGAQLYGSALEVNDRRVISYNLGVFNGEGINLKDKNTQKTVIARLTAEPVKNFKIAGSAMLGSYAAEYFKRDRFSVGAAYDCGKTFLKGEYLYGRTGGLNKADLSDKICSNGYWATIGARLGDNQEWMPAVRYETFTMDKDNSDVNQKDICVSLTWIPVKVGKFQLRTMLQYVREIYEGQPDKSDANVFGVSFLAGF